MIQIEFTPWNSFMARKRPLVIKKWLRDVADASDAAFKNMKQYPPASTPGEYPAIRTGKLRASIRTVVTANSATIGSNMRYSIFLRRGTSRMARRKMSDNALREGVAKSRLGHWVEFVRN